MDPKGRTSPGYRMHAFVCGHSRPEGASRGCCSDKGSLELMKQFKLAAKEKGYAVEPGARGFFYNVEPIEIVDFFEIGTRAFSPSLMLK